MTEIPENHQWPLGGSVPPPVVDPAAPAYDPAAPAAPVPPVAVPVMPAQPTAMPQAAQAAIAQPPAQPIAPPAAPAFPADHPVNLAFRPFATTAAQLTTLFTFLTVLGGAMLSGILLCAGASSAKNAPGFSDLLPVAIGMTLSGKLNTKQQAFFIQADANLTLLAMGTLGLIGAGIFLLTRRRRQVDGSLAPLSAVAMRSGAEALAISLVSAILLGLLKSSVKSGDTNMELAGSFFGIFAMVLLLVFLAQFLGRAGDLLFSRLPAPAATPLRELGAMLWSVGVVLAPVALVGDAIFLISQDAAGTIAFLPVYLGNLMTALVALGSFGALRVNTNSLSNMFGGDNGGKDISKAQFVWNLMGGWSVLLFLVMLVLLVVIAVRVGTRRQRLAVPDLSRTWQLPALAWVVALVFMHLLAPAHLDISGLGQEHSMGVSITWWSSMTFALLMALASVAAEYLPTFLYNTSPTLLRLCAGSAALGAWVQGTTMAPGAAPTGGFPVAAQTGGFPTTPGVAPTGGFPADAQAGGFPVAAQTGGFPTTPGVAPTGGFPGAAPTGGFPVAAQTGGFPTTPSAAVTQPVTAPLPEPKPMDPATRKRVKRIGLSALVLGLLLAGAFGTITYMNSKRTPEVAVRAYLQLIADGKASEANAVVDPGVPNQQRLLLTDAALQGASSRIVVNDVKPSKIESKDHLVTASVSLDGKLSEFDLEVTEGPKEYGFLRTWKIQTPAITKFNLTSDEVNQIVVSGVPIDFPTVTEPGNLQVVEQYAYFGIYSLALPSKTATYLEPEVTSLRSEPRVQTGKLAGEPVHVTTKGNAKLEELVLKAVNDQAAACVTTQHNQDKQCPYELRQTKMESMSVHSKATKVTITKGTSFTSGSITFKYKPAPTTWTPKPKEDKVKYLMTGEIKFPADGGEPVVEVNKSQASWGD
ncbi:hypothetical protein [Actinomyces bovis]|nr:hypothetical protein [Actinomyces bovis]